MRFSKGCVRNAENEPYQIQHTPLVYGDLDIIDSCIAETLGNPSAADRLMEKSIDQLKDFPYSGSEVGDAYLAAKGYRKLVVDNCIVFHLVSDEQRMVIVMRIIHGAREYQNLL